jgi:Acetyltransferase (GNAT) domain
MAGPSIATREPFRFRILHEFPDAAVERAWRDCLARADWPAHYVSPEYFLEPYWTWPGCRRFAVLATEGEAIVAVLTGINEGGSVISGNECRPQICFDRATDHSRAVNALARGVAAEAASAELVTIYSWTPMTTLRPLGFRVRPFSGTVALDLRLGQEALFSRLDRSLRENIRYATKHAVEVVQASTDEDVAAFYAVHRRWLQTRRKTLADNVHIPLPILTAACRLRDNRRLFLAKHAGQVIAGWTVRFSRGGLLEGEMSSSLDEHLRLHPNALLVWKTIEWGCAERFPWYSMNGDHPFLRRTGGSVLPVYRHRFDRTWLRRHELRDTLEESPYGRRLLPVLRTIRRGGRSVRAAFERR